MNCKICDSKIIGKKRHIAYCDNCIITKNEILEKKIFGKSLIRNCNYIQKKLIMLRLSKLQQKWMMQP
jgi:hypothetical protein